MQKRYRQMLTIGGCILAMILLGTVSAAATAGDPEDQTAMDQPLTLEDIRSVHFTDVSTEDAAYDAICYMASQAIMRGVGGNRFDPDGLVTRAELVVLLQRMGAEMSETPAPLSVYSDVSADDWCADAVAWASNAGIVTGNKDGTFTPMRAVTRTELAVMLHRFATAWDADTTASGDLSQWTDGASVPSYAVSALSYALERDLLDCVVTETIHGKLPVSRRQCAQILTALAATVGGEPLAAQIAEQDDLTPIVSRSRANHSQLQAAVDAAAAKYGAIGVQVAVIENGYVTDTFASGWATKGEDKMTAQHKMRVASISKVVIGMEAMRLREQGVIDLNAPIGTYWGISMKNPYFLNDPVTIRSLMTHTSSIVVAGDDVSRSYNAVRSRLAGSSGYRKVRPGSIYGWAYNNYGFSVLGMTLELAADDTLDDLLHRDLLDFMDIDAAFAPGDLRDSSRLVTLAYHGGVVARSVSMQRSLHSVDTPGASGGNFAGGLTISACDLGKLVALLANDGRYEGLLLLKPGSVSLMETIIETQLGDGFYQGLPLRYRTNIYGRGRLYYHTGSAYGVYNCMSYDPDTGDGVVVLTVGASATKDKVGIYAICGEISHEIYNTTKD